MVASSLAAVERDQGGEARLGELLALVGTDGTT